MQQEKDEEEQEEEVGRKGAGGNAQNTNDEHISSCTAYCAPRGYRSYDVKPSPATAPMSLAQALSAPSLHTFVVSRRCYQYIIHRSTGYIMHHTY